MLLAATQERHMPPLGADTSNAFNGHATETVEMNSFGLPPKLISVAVHIFCIK